MKTLVARRYRFRGTHSLPAFPEPWCFPHQHDYTVEVVAPGGTPTDILDECWRAVGADGNVDVDALWSPSTVEHIAAELLSDFGDVALCVTVWEDRQRWGRAER